MIHSFTEKLKFANGKSAPDQWKLSKMIPNATNIRRGSLSEDKAGGDYIVAMKDGAQLFVDAKTRTPGCSRFWRQGPEVALEIWSVMPGGKYRTPTVKAQKGWTLRNDKRTDLVLFTFDSRDSEDVFLIDYHNLRTVFLQNLEDWQARFKLDIQDSGEWESQAVFVPIVIVQNAISQLQLTKPSNQNDIWLGDNSHLPVLRCSKCNYALWWRESRKLLLCRGCQ